MLRVLDLFSGIGGFSLGLERAGLRTVAFCEIDPYCRRVLARHWPDVPVFGDITKLSGAEIISVTDAKRREWGADNQGPSSTGRNGHSSSGIDVICGGFPCQDISTAGKGAGITGERSGLWKHYARIIGEVRPRYAIIENVSALLSRGLGDVLYDLSAFGYDAEWHCIPASAVGAPHRRDRIWIVAYPNSQPVRGDGHPGDAGPSRTLQGEAEQRERFWPDAATGGSRKDVADAERRRLQGRDVQCAKPRTIIPAAFSWHCGGSEFGAPWRTEPDVGRVAYGVPAAMDRLRSLGNAVVPQIPEMIGRAIMAQNQSLTLGTG